MGGGGVMLAAIHAIRSNKKLLSKRKSKGFSLVSNSAKKTRFNLPKATTQEINEIRMRMRNENKKRRAKQLVFLGVFVVIIVAFLVHYS